MNNKKAKKDKYIALYKKENIKTFKISINKKKNPELIRYIETFDNKNKFFLKLIKEAYEKEEHYEQKH